MVRLVFIFSPAQACSLGDYIKPHQGLSASFCVKARVEIIKIALFKDAVYTNVDFLFFVSGRFFRVVYKLAVTFQAMVLPKITHSEFPHRAPHNTASVCILIICLSIISPIFLIASLIKTLQFTLEEFK